MRSRRKPAAERSAADSLDLVQAQYKAGGASYLQVLTAEQTYQTAAVALVKARAQRFADTAALFQALGGGWWNRNDVAANPTDSRVRNTVSTYSTRTPMVRPSIPRR